MTLDGQTVVRILIVDDNRLTIENVSRLLDFEPGLTVVGSAENGLAGINQAKELSPDIVLMDINMPDMDGIEACRQITQASPRSRVMMMSVQSDMAYLKRAMNAGAREFLIKPFDYDELINSVRRVHAADPTPAELAAMAVTDARLDRAVQPSVDRMPDRGVLIAVFGSKGGVGCSTIATNLAIALGRRREAQVLLIDADLLFGDIDALLDLQPVHRIVDVLEMFDPDDPDLIGRMLTDHSSGVTLLAAPARPELAELVQPGMFLSLLEAVRATNDYIVVDLGSRFTELAQRVLDMADRVIMTITPEVTAIKNTNMLLSTASVRTYSPEKVVPLLNKYSDVWGINPTAVGRAIGRPVGLVVPVDGDSMRTADNRGDPVVLSSPRSSVAKSMVSLEKLMPNTQQLGEEMAATAWQEREGVPPPIVTQPTSELDWEELDRAFDQAERRGCARWVPFLGGDGIG